MKNLITINNPRFFSTQNNKSFNKIIHINFNDYLRFGADSYIDIFKNNLNLGVQYSYLVKISKDNLFFTLSERQKFFLLDSTSMDEDRLESFEDYLNTNLSRILELYKKVIDGGCDIITFEFFPININTNIEEFRIKNIEDVDNSIFTNKSNLIKKEFSLFDTNILNNKGILLNFDINNKEFTNNIEDLNYFIFDNVKHLEYNKYYYTNYRGKYYVITEYIKDNIIIKQCFDKFGANLYSIEDIIADNGDLIRKNGNFYTHFNSNNEIINVKKDITFNSIYSKFKLSDKLHVNQNIGTIDLETFKHDDISLCYAIGFYTDKDYQTYYIDKDNLDSYLLIHFCINELLRPKFKPYTFYCHNLGGFDAPFIIKALLEYNKNVDKAERYTFDAFTRDGNIIRLTIKRKIDGKIRSFSIHDSLPILSMSLRRLCKAYNLEQAKSYFPYNFVNKNTLFYIGNTPDKSYYEIPKDSKEEGDFNNFYDTNYSKTWSLQQETLDYLMLDLKSLYEVLKIVNLQMFILFDIQMTESSTVSGIAMRIFLNKFYKDSRDKLPLINSNQIYNDIYKAYYGGRVEVFIPKPINNEKLYYYDVNSLYPFASLNDLPGLNWSYNEFINTQNTPKLDNLFGFYYCKIESSFNYLGLLPFRNEKGGLSFPQGKWYGWYFSEELKLAAKHGYKINVIKGYTTDKSENIFDKFVNSIYQVKLKPRNLAEKNVAKLILNSLIGRFGMNPDKMVTKLLNHKEHNIICSTRVLKNSTMLDNDNYLDTFSTDINKNVCEEFGLDYAKVLNSTNFNIRKAKPISNNTISISTAAAILSYSRIYMADTMSAILNRGGRIYYTDTDSIVTNIKLPDNMIDSKELGKFKLENEVLEAYFISDKTYLIKNIEGKIIKKAKSVKEDSLDINDYKRFYNLEVYQSAIKMTSKKDFKAGSVNISSKLVTLNVDKYTKRERLFENNRWVNSRPIWINEVDKSLIVYTPKYLILFDTKPLIVYTPKYLILFDTKPLIVYTPKDIILIDTSRINTCVSYNKSDLNLINRSVINTAIINMNCKDPFKSLTVTDYLHTNLKVEIQTKDNIVHKLCNSKDDNSKPYFNLLLDQLKLHIVVSNFWFIANIPITWIYKLKLKLYIIRENLIDFLPKYIIFIYLMLNLSRIPNFLENMLYISSNIWSYDCASYDLLFINLDLNTVKVDTATRHENIPELCASYKNKELINTSKEFSTLVQSKTNDVNYRSYAKPITNTNYIHIRSDEETSYSIFSLRKSIKLFFKMLDFTNLKYYPSLFQNYNFPRVFEVKYSYICESYSTASIVHTENNSISSISNQKDIHVVAQTKTINTTGEVVIEYKESITQTPIINNHVVRGDVSSLYSDNISISSSSSVSNEKELNNIKYYDNSLNTDYRTSIESELIACGEGLDTPITMIKDNYDEFDTPIIKDTYEVENDVYHFNDKCTDTAQALHLDIQSQLIILNNQITNYKDTLDTRDITIKTLKLNTDNLNSRIEKLLKDLVVNDLKIIDLESKINEDVYKIGELTNEIDSLKSNKTSLNEELGKFKELLQDNNKVIDSNYEELYSLKEQIVELNRQISFLSNTKSEFEELLRSNDQELIEHYKETKMLKVKVEEYELKTKNILEELKLEKSKSEEYLEWYDDTSKQLDEAKAEIAHLKRELYCAS